MKRRASKAFTLIELLTVTAIVCILAGLLLTAVNSAMGKAKRIQCVSHLRNIGMAVRMRADDGDGRLPVSLAGHPGARQPVVIRFLEISRELKDPRLAICPSDKRKSAASWLTLTNGNISYFRGSGGNTSHDVIAGDRNLLTNGTPVGMGNIAIRPGTIPSWGQSLHRSKGNIAFGDGSVQQLNSQGLATALPKGIALAVP